MTDHHARVAKIRQIVVGRGLDAILVSHPANRFYLTGYTADDVAPNSVAGALLIARNAALLLTSAVNLPWARAEAPAFIEVELWERPFPTSLAETIKTRGWRKIGFEEESILYSFYSGVTETLGADVELVRLGADIDRPRRVKDEWEQATIAEAIRIGDAAFVAATEDLAPGTTEKQLARRIDDHLRELGADGTAFPTIVAAGLHAARPHHSPSDRPLGLGEPIIVDMGARVRGYNGDLTRTIWIGEPDATLRAVYPIVQAMQDAAFARIAAGTPVKDVDIATREVANNAGFGQYLVHGLGHGIGARVHEAPSTSEKSEDIYQTGEVTTVEPGLYIPDWGGVRIEDVVVVEPGGHRNLTKAPKRGPDESQVSS